MEGFTRGAKDLGSSLGGATEGGATGVLGTVLSPGGLMVIGALLLVAMWMGRK